MPAFLSARWSNVALLSWPIDHLALEPLLPTGLVLDLWGGSAYISLVGLWFDDVRVGGVPSPVRRYEEVNLRFYVRRQYEQNGDQRGVVFIRQLVPHKATAWLARWKYNEPFTAVPMCHRFEESRSGAPSTQRRVAYGWRLNGRRHGFWIESDGQSKDPPAGSLDEFLTARYWGYNGKPGGITRSYSLTRPAWSTTPGARWEVDIDADSLYGSSFGRAMSLQPASVLLASGSRVQLHWPSQLDAVRVDGAPAS